MFLFERGKKATDYLEEVHDDERYETGVDLGKCQGRSQSKLPSLSRINNSSCGSHDCNSVQEGW